MKKFAVIGDPISHSLSPIMHNWIFNELNINATYEKIHVRKNKLNEIINKIHDGTLDGINVTLPHKSSIISHMDEINPRAKEIGAINMVMKVDCQVIGNNTDWYGFMMAMKRNKISLVNDSIILLGFGGVAKSILFALKNYGIKKIIVLKRSIDTKLSMEDNLCFVPFNKADEIIKDDSIIINTTPLGMNDDKSPFDKDLMNKKQILIDVIYTPLETTFIRYGKEVGALTVNGLDMFIEQGLASLDLWFGTSISKKVNFTQLKAYLGSQLC